MHTHLHTSFVWKSSTGVSALTHRCRRVWPSLIATCNWFKRNTRQLTWNSSFFVQNFISFVIITKMYRTVVTLLSSSSCNTQQKPLITAAWVVATAEESLRDQNRFEDDLIILQVIGHENVNWTEMIQDKVQWNVLWIVRFHKSK